MAVATPLAAATSTVPTTYQLYLHLAQDSIPPELRSWREINERIKALNPRIRAVSRSGVKLTAISQGAAERLIQLQEQLVTSALTDAATQLERAARADNVKDLVKDQAEVLRATRERIVSDITEAVTILKDAGGDVRKVATHTYESVTGKAAPAAPKAKAARRRVKRAVRKAPARKK